MYAESGQNIETPLSAAQSIHDMVLQSWGGAIRIFPAVPAAWPDLVFGDFRAEGAFLVSARRSGGRTAWIRSEEHTSELQSLMRISYAVFCLQKKNTTHTTE